jgi:hypothetical protein
LDGVAPKDFVGEGGSWPDGPFRSPWTAEQRDELGLTVSAERALVEAVAGLGRLVVRYKVWLRSSNTTSESVSRRLRVSRGRLSALLTGSRFPSWDLVALIQGLIEPARPTGGTSRPSDRDVVKKTHRGPPYRSPQP